MNETNISQLCRIKLSRLGFTMFRNNTGKLKDANGRWVTFGLCTGSCDLIGYLPSRITVDMVGRIVPVFAAVEVKSATGRLSDEQTHFLRTIEEAGGIAGMVRCEDDCEQLTSWRER